MPQRHSITMVFNAGAGGAQEGVADQLRDFCRQRAVEFRATSERENAATLAVAAALLGHRRIIVAGGDGTVSQVVNGLARAVPRELRELQLGVVPLGTGNDLARSLDVPLDHLAGACELAVTAASRPMDLVRMETAGQPCRWLVNAASGGFGGEVTANIRSDEKRRWGAFSYWTTAVSRLVDLHAYQLTLELDGRPLSRSAYGLTLAHGRFVGGGFPIAPKALLDDGRLELVAVPVLPALELIAAGVQFSLGWSDSGVLSCSCQRVRVQSEPAMLFSVDGDPQETLDATFEVVAAAIGVVGGPRAAFRVARPGGS